MATHSRETSPIGQEKAEHWIPVEFASADLGDGRLNERLLNILDAFSSMPNGSIPEACKTWAGAKGAYRWESPGTLIINIGDREADVYELFQQASEETNQCHLIVRSSWNRRVNHPDEEESEEKSQPERLLWQYLESQPPAATQELEVPRKGKQPKRVADVEIRYCLVNLGIPTHTKNRKLSPVTLWAILVSEPSPPEGVEPLCWRLLTTLEVESLEDALKYVEYYSRRFTIELFHKILKSGCGVEERQLESADGLRNCLALDSVIAWRILFMTMIGRTVPNLPCTALFEDDEWQALYCFLNETREPPAAPPSLGEAIRLVARLGGLLGRKGDGHPGAIVLWRGMQALVFIRASWVAFGPGTTKKRRR